MGQDTSSFIDNDSLLITSNDSLSITSEEKNLQQPTGADEQKPVVLRNVPDSVWKKMQTAKEFQYANDSAYWVEKIQSEDNNFLVNFFDFLGGKSVRTALYILIACVLLFAIYRVIVINKLYVFYSPGKHISDEDEITKATIDDKELDEKINNAVINKNFRLAVRYHYLKTLGLLNAKNWISYHAKATNNDYLQQVGQYEIAEDFRFLTKVYEYVWYGEFKLEEQQFETVSDSFNNFYKAINS